MRVAIHNHYAGQEVAETEFSKRICHAASNLGWEAVEVGSSAEVRQCNPDFVLALHFRTPKLTRYPTYGSMVTPPVYFTQDDQFVKNILSYDGYLSSSNSITAWLGDILYQTGKKHFIAPFYTSCHNVSYRPPRLSKPRLLYAGTNWDGPRHRELFQKLDTKPYMEIYGPGSAWSYLSQSYRGTLPFDGSSILDALHRAGVGLCLHRQEHCAAATPSARVFEIAASGAIAICQEHPFIREVFGASVLYLDSAADDLQTTAQISKYMDWIEENQEEALQLSKQAHAIFSQNFTLEKLLSDMAPRHRQLVAQKGFVKKRNRSSQDSKVVQFIVRVGDRSSEYVERALDSLIDQTAGRVGALIVWYRNVPGLSKLLRKYADRLPVEVVKSHYTGCRSTQLWAGLNAVSSEYFGILDDDDVIHPNHVHSLVQLLDRCESCGVAYSGSIRVWEPGRLGSTISPPGASPVEQSELAYFEPFDVNRLVTLNNFITSNAFIARSSLLTDLGEDPHLPLLEDLFLLLYLCRKTSFVFSYEATCELYWRGDKNDNATWLDPRQWESAIERVQTILWKQSYYSTQSVGPSKLDQVETALVQSSTRFEDTLSRLQARLGQIDARLENDVFRLQAQLGQVETVLAQTNARLEVARARLERYTNLPFLNAVRRLRRVLLRLPPPPDP